MRCNCGYDFASGPLTDKYLGLDHMRPKRPRNKPTDRIVIGVCLLVGGTAVFALTGRLVLLPAGAIIFGLIQILTGMDYWMQDRRDSRRDAD